MTDYDNTDANWAAPHASPPPPTPEGASGWRAWSTKKKAAVFGGGGFLVVSVLAAAAGGGSDGNTDVEALAATTTSVEAVEATSTTEAAITTEATQPPTTQAPTTQAPTTAAPTTQAPTTQAPTTRVVFDNDELFDLTMLLVSTDDTLGDLCPDYRGLSTENRYTMIDLFFTPEIDLSGYPGWDSDDITRRAVAHFDQAC